MHASNIPRRSEAERDDRAADVSSRGVPRHLEGRASGARREGRNATTRSWRHHAMCRCRLGLIPNDRRMATGDQARPEPVLRVARHEAKARTRNPIPLETEAMAHPRPHARRVARFPPALRPGGCEKETSCSVGLFGRHYTRCTCCRMCLTFVPTAATLESMHVSAETWAYGPDRTGGKE